MSLEVFGNKSLPGAEILGLDVSAPLDGDDALSLKWALADHCAVFANVGRVSARMFADFAGAFGSLEPHILSQYHHPESPRISIISANMDDRFARTTKAPSGAFWHSDQSYKPDGSKAIFLYSEIVPNRGGATKVINMMDALNSLPAYMRDFIKDKKAMHIWGWNSGGATPDLTDVQENSGSCAIHPMIRKHPVNLRDCLFVNPGFTAKIMDVPLDEGQQFLTEMFDHVFRNAAVYHHQWAKHQIVGIDNLSAMHCASNDYTQPRRLLRAIVT